MSTTKTTITVTYTMNADNGDWDTAYGTDGDTRTADMVSWLDNQAREAWTLADDVRGTVKATVVHEATPVARG